MKLFGQYSSFYFDGSGLTRALGPDQRYFCYKIKNKILKRKLDSNVVSCPYHGRDLFG
jgi:hypothetical protein